MNIEHDKKIYFGYFSDFTDPTILFSGQPSAFKLFQEFFRAMFSKEEASIDFKDVPFFVCTNANIILRITSKPTGMKRVNNNFFNWGLSKNELETFIDYLGGLAETPTGHGGGHYYFECGTLDDVKVKVSADEYGVQIFEKLTNKI